MVLDLDVKGWAAAQSAQAWASLAAGEAAQARAGGGSVSLCTSITRTAVPQLWGVSMLHWGLTVTPTEGNEARHWDGGMEEGTMKDRK